MNQPNVRSCVAIGLVIAFFGLVLYHHAMSSGDASTASATSSPPSSDYLSTSAPQVNRCAIADDSESASATAYNGSDYSTSYHYAIKGLDQNADCSDTDLALVNSAYLTSLRGLAEHHLGQGDSRSDINEANMLLEKCITHFYATPRAAGCQTQMENNIREKISWDMSR